MLLVSKQSVACFPDGATLSLPDIVIAAGDRMVLCGPSGSGKSTLLSVLSGLQKPCAGSVTYQGEDLYAGSARARDSTRGRAFGFVFQTLHLLPALTVAQNIALALPDPASTGRLETLLSDLGLQEKAHSLPHTLSQGERQRVAIARAVVHNPSVIFADEPTSALDDQNTQNVMMLLSTQATATNAALVVATHDARILPFFSKRVDLAIAQRQAA